jgi:ribose transport system substrate-binding protein
MSATTTTPFRRNSRLLLAGALVALAASVTACSSGSSASNSSASSSSSTGSATGSSSASSSSAGVQTAEADVSAHLTTPATISVSTPLKSPAPSGKTIVYMQCELPQCALEGQGFQQAAKALGWTYKVVNFQTTDVPSLVAGMNQALDYKPVAVAVAGEDQSQWASVIPAYQKAGVIILPFNAGPVSLSAAVPAEVADPNDWADAGKLLGDWFVANSNGHGNAVFLDVSAFAVLKEFTDAATAEITKLCPGCKVTTLDDSLTEIGNNQIVPSVVSAVQRDPSVDYVLSADGAFISGLASSLNNIGRGSVKIAGGDPDISDEQNLLTGTESAWVGQAYQELGWQVMDATLRHLEGMPIPVGDGGWPLQLIVKANVGTPNNSLQAPTNYQAQFEKLWGVS